MATITFTREKSSPYFALYGIHNPTFEEMSEIQEKLRSFGCSLFQVVNNGFIAKADYPGSGSFPQTIEVSMPAG